LLSLFALGTELQPVSGQTITCEWQGMVVSAEFLDDDGVHNSIRCARATAGTGDCPSKSAVSGTKSGADKRYYILGFAHRFDWSCLGLDF